MKSTAKDIILLCKGWYNQELYPTLLEAFKEYYRQRYVYGSHNKDEFLNESFILRVILLEVIREIARDYPDRLSQFMSSFLVSGQIIFGIPDNNNKDYDYQLFYRIINFLSCLRMSGDDIKTIDTSEYFMDVEDEGRLHKKLIEEII